MRYRRRIDLTEKDFISLSNIGATYYLICHIKIDRVLWQQNSLVVRASLSYLIGFRTLAFVIYQNEDALNKINFP